MVEVCTVKDWLDFPSYRYCKVHKHKFSHSDFCNGYVATGTYGTDGTISNLDMSTHVLGGRVGLGYSCYVPHNARFYFNFDRWNFKPSFNFKPINSGSEFLVESFEGCSFRIKKNMVEVVNKVDSHRVFQIYGSSDDRMHQVKDAIDTLRLECINAFKLLISRFGGASDFIVIKEWIPDNKVTNERIIDSVPKDMTFRNDIVKKVYSDSDVEFSDPIYTANYFRNVGLFDFAPEIADQLKSIQDERLEFSKALALYTEQINLHLKVEARQLEVQEETLKTLKAIQTHHRGSDVVSSYNIDSSHPTSISDLKRLKMIKVRKLLSNNGWGGSVW